MTERSNPLQDKPNSRGYHKGNVAEDLRKAAERILATESLENITIRRLTREVGVTPGNFYNHFRSLDDLLSRIALAAFNDVIDSVLETWSRPGAKPDLLVASATDFISFCLRNEGLARFMLRRLSSGENDRFDMASTRSFTEVIRFIYDAPFESGPSATAGRQYGIAFGYIALCYGFALALAESRFDIDTSDEDELSQFIRSGILPFLDGSAAAILSAGKNIPPGQETSSDTA